MRKVYALILGFLCLVGAHAQRVKDLTHLEGVRSNPLVGYGLVVGLDGSGDKETLTKESFKSMLTQLGITVPQGVPLTLKNSAAVVVHAELPPFAKPGQRIDVTVSSLGDAKSLRGGTLIMAPLKGVDGQIYALAQGSLVVSGAGASGQDGSSVTVNIPSVGRIPNGATVEKALPNPLAMSSELTFHLNYPDFTTAMKLSQIINQTVAPKSAQALDASSVVVRVPEHIENRVHFIAAIENLPLVPSQSIAKVVINPRTGTIIIGENVRVSPTAVTHGQLVVEIKEDKKMSDNPYAPTVVANNNSTVNVQGGNNATVVDNSSVSIKQEKTKMFLLDTGVSLETLVKAVNEVGVSPSDLMSILESLKQAGALHAELEVI
jgi:flagellar P-ring protein precursor FlgI